MFVHGGKPLILINPKIKALSSEMKVTTEGCLSFPNLQIDIARPIKVKVEYYDMNMKKKEIIGDDN